jgi:hypothetical protein
MTYDAWDLLGPEIERGLEGVRVVLAERLDDAPLLGGAWYAASLATSPSDAERAMARTRRDK